MHIAGYSIALDLPWALLLRLFFLCVATYYISRTILLLIAVARVHAKHRISAYPDCRPTMLEHLPIAFRPKLGEMIRTLIDLGFVTVANVTMREPFAPQQITQCLLVNRAAGVRAAIFCTIVLRKYESQVVLVSEFSDGTEIRTTNANKLLPPELRRPGMHMQTMSRTTPLDALYRMHMTLTAEHAPANATFVLPPEGKEFEYIAARHAKVRAKVAPGRGYTLDETGDYYCPTWGKSFWIIFAKQSLVGRIRRWIRQRWHARKRQEPSPRPSS